MSSKIDVTAQIVHGPASCTLNIEILKIRQPGKALRTVLRAEHCNRFLTVEAYHRWIANSWINNWIILDCRHSRPQKYRMIASFLPLGPHS